MMLGDFVTKINVYSILSLKNITQIQLLVKVSIYQFYVKFIY